MKTSRIARETVSIGKNAEVLKSRRTRSSLNTSIRAFAAGDADLTVEHKDDDGNDSSSLSSIGPSGTSDIEDALVSLSSRKRKRGLGSPSTTVTTTSTLAVATRTSPRKADIKNEDGSPAKIKKGRKQPFKRVVDESGEVNIHPPANWQEIYTAVQEMRKKVLAPVDTMGCESLAEETRSPRVSPPLQPTSPSSSLTS